MQGRLCFILFTAIVIENVWETSGNWCMPVDVYVIIYNNLIHDIARHLMLYYSFIHKQAMKAILFFNSDIITTEYDLGPHSCYRSGEAVLSNALQYLVTTSTYEGCVKSGLLLIVSQSVHKTDCLLNAIARLIIITSSSKVANKLDIHGNMTEGFLTMSSSTNLKDF